MSVRVPRGCSYNLSTQIIAPNVTDFCRNVIGTGKGLKRFSQSVKSIRRTTVNMDLPTRASMMSGWYLLADFRDATDIKVIWSSVWFQRMIYLHLKLRALMQWLWIMFLCALGCMLNWTVLHVCWLNEFSIHPKAPPFCASDLGISCLLKYIYYQPVCGFAGMHDFLDSFWGQWGVHVPRFVIVGQGWRYFSLEESIVLLYKNYESQPVG